MHFYVIFVLSRSILFARVQPHLHRTQKSTISEMAEAVEAAEAAEVAEAAEAETSEAEISEEAEVAEAEVAEAGASAVGVGGRSGGRTPLRPTKTLPRQGICDRRLRRAWEAAAAAERRHAAGKHPNDDAVVG